MELYKVRLIAKGYYKTSEIGYFGTLLCCQTEVYYFAILLSCKSELEDVLGKCQKCLLYGDLGEDGSNVYVLVSIILTFSLFLPIFRNHFFFSTLETVF